MNRSLPLLLLLLLPLAASCASTTETPPDPCPRAGVVLPDARDVERDAEGIATTAFGTQPDHQPDYPRAAGVFTLLQTVWTSTKAACPELPTSVVSTVDDAISRLSVGIPGQDQEGTAYAANDIHVATSPLFAFFNREKPIELEEMDGLFLRLGLDAWFDHWPEFDAHLATIQTDWEVVKPVVATLTPTCHRIAGTATVSGDVDQTIAELLVLSSSHDAGLAEIGSDDGLSEVDILEQLFDCPPDGLTPDAGLGAACTADADCGDATLVCDVGNAGGRCAPDPALTRIGAACTTTVDCGTYPRSACNNEVGDGFPGGYCVMEPCNDVQVCSPGSTCVSLPFETTACYKACVDDADCRTSDGYVCQLFPTVPPDGYGPTDRACAFACTQDTDCRSPLTCDVASGRCKP